MKTNIGSSTSHPTVPNNVSTAITLVGSKALLPSPHQLCADNGRCARAALCSSHPCCAVARLVNCNSNLHVKVLSPKRQRNAVLTEYVGKCSQLAIAIGMKGIRNDRGLMRPLNQPLGILKTITSVMLIFECNSHIGSMATNFRAPYVCEERSHVRSIVGRVQTIPDLWNYCVCCAAFTLRCWTQCSYGSEYSKDQIRIAKDCMLA